MKYALLGFCFLGSALFASYLFTACRLAHFAPPPGAMAYEVAGTTLYAIVEGTGRPTVVLIHGGGGSIDDWGPLRKRLRRQFRVVTVERPGNGWSGPYPYEPDDYLVANVAILRMLLEKLAVRRAVVVGWSYGGAVALRLAAEHPHFVDQLVLLCAIGPGYDPWQSPLGSAIRLGHTLDMPFVRAVFDLALRPGIVAILPDALWLKAQYGPDWNALSERTKDRTILGMLRPKLTALREVAQIKDDLSRLKPYLSRVEQPTLIISGELDPVIPEEVGANLADVLPNAKHVVLPGARHAHHVVEPEEVSDLIRRFVEARH